jgi:membrane protease YdiL (CAAX protease family)
MIVPHRSERFERWIAPMRRRASLWRVALGVLLAGGLWIAAVGFAVTLAEEAGFAADRGIVVVYLVTFGVLIAGLGAAMRLLHRLPGARLLGPEERIERRPLLRGILFVAIVATALFLPMLLVEPPERQHPVWLWALWLPAALPALFVQATAEEVVFRGYLQGMLAARFASRLVWWVLPALLFGLLHWNPEMGANAWLMVLVASVMGLVLGDVAARSGGLSLPIGLHFANNVFAMLVMATPSQLSGLALWLSPLDAGDAAAVRAGLLGNLALILVLWGGYLLVVWWRRR